MFKRLAIILAVTLAASGAAVMNGNLATHAAAGVTVSHPGWPDRTFSVAVDGPVVLTWAGVSDAFGSGGCVVDHGVDPRIVASYSATCSGPGGVQGLTQIYADPSCVDGVWLYKMLVVAADGVVVFDDRAHGGCEIAVSTTIPPVSTTLPATTTPSTTLAPGTRYCAQWTNKPTHHCIRWYTAMTGPLLRDCASSGCTPPVAYMESGSRFLARNPRNP